MQFTQFCLKMNLYISPSASHNYNFQKKNVIVQARNAERENGSNESRQPSQCRSASDSDQSQLHMVVGRSHAHQFTITVGSSYDGFVSD